MKMIQKPLSRHRGDDDGTEWLCVLPVIDLKCVNPQEEIDPRVCFCVSLPAPLSAVLALPAEQVVDQLALCPVNLMTLRL